MDVLRHRQAISVPKVQNPVAQTESITTAIRSSTRRILAAGTTRQTLHPTTLIYWMKEELLRNAEMGSITTVTEELMVL
jgi:hypothetical protein